MAINKKITELSSKVIEPEDIFIIADDTNNYQITMADISGALLGAAPPPGESTYAYFSDFQNNVGSVTIKEYDLGGSILQKVISDDFSNFKAYLQWDGPGATHYVGTGYIENIEIPFPSNVTELGTMSRNFEGFLNNLDVSSNMPLQLSGEANGQSVILELELAGPAPTPYAVRIEDKDKITTAAGLPRSTEIYPGDLVDVYAWFDFSDHTSSEEPFEFRIGSPTQSSTAPGQAYGADDLLVGTSFAEWNQPWLPHPQTVLGTDGTPLSGIMLQSTVNNVSNGTIEHGTRVECKNRYNKTNSTTSFEVTAGGAMATELDGVMSAGTVKYHHSHDVGLPPTVNIAGVEYPGSSPSNPKVTTNLQYDQQAIKAGDSALVENTAADYDTILYESPGNQLTIENPTVYEQFKKVTYLAGGYNVNTNNFKITATKSTLSTVKESVVKIANTPLVLDIKNLSSRMPLKSSPNGNGETFPLQSNQLQLIAPTISVDTSQSPTSVLTRVGSASTNTNGNNFKITVKDIDQKGTFIWQNILGVNLAGIETTQVKAGDENYTIGGFISREISASPSSTWKGLYPIGTTVTDPLNVTFYSDSVAKNLIYYDGVPAGTVISMAAGPNNQMLANRNFPGSEYFTIVTPSTDSQSAAEITVDPNGNYLYILDGSIRNMNSGTIDATGETEEN